jgi:hypothetical protein
MRTERPKKEQNCSLDVESFSPSPFYVFLKFYYCRDPVPPLISTTIENTDREREKTEFEVENFPKNQLNAN